MNAKRIVAQGDRMIEEALAEIAFKIGELNGTLFDMELEALRQIDRDLVEAEIVDIGAPQNQLEEIRC